ncbi:hypothetical protein JSE7799_01301 [Jannaschia seosinensis]|uniref:Transposase n=1 Tax=Jannaschia seosinensis TaxID=313367 RepID=A0A0M7BB75_9RHOB|nr:hypothetical protein JSE7799_01301 [Jannaschia seosinensis]
MSVHLLSEIGRIIQSCPGFPLRRHRYLFDALLARIIHEKAAEVA